MWLQLSEGVFYFGPGGVTVLKQIDLRDKPKSFIYRTELYANGIRIDTVKEATEEILQSLRGEVK